jgi:hypothetical protein
MAQRMRSAEEDLRAWFPYSVRLLGTGGAGVIERYRRLERDGYAATEGACWVGFLRSDEARVLGVPRYVGDVAALEMATAALAEEPGAADDAAFVARANARLPAPAADEIRSLVPVSGRHVRIERYQFDVRAITRAIDDCDRLEPFVRPCPSTVMLLWASADSRPRIISVSPGTEALLAACDKRTDCSGIVRRLAGPKGVDDGLEDQVLGAIEGLRSVNVVALLSPSP